MPVVDKNTFSEGLLGARMIGAVLAGTSEIYVRFEKHSFTTPGAFSFTLPDWATGYGVVMSGGGGGGRCGDGGNGAQGYGGRGGDVVGLWGRMTNDNNMVMSGVIGAGGAGGRGGSSGLFGETGGTTSIVTHSSNAYSAAGGTGNPTSGMTNGGVTAVNFSELFSRYINATPGSTYINGPGGTGNAGSGQRGGGGAGGNGGYFGSYYHGGKGGDGFVEIYVWGLPRHQGGTVEITLGSDLEARDQFRAALSARGYNYQTIKYIPFDIQLVGSGSARELLRGCASLTSVLPMDTTGVTNMRSMFNGCSSLTSVPDMDTSGVMNMGWMFQDCSSLTTVPEMDTSNVVSMNSMFRSCASLTSVPDLDTSGVITTEHMFYNCAALTDGNVRLIGKHPAVRTDNMIDGSGLTREPFYYPDGTPDDTIPDYTIPDVVQITLGAGYEARDQLRAALSALGLDFQTVTEIPFDIELVGSGTTTAMFNDCWALTSVPAMDTSQVTNVAYMFSYCSSLTSVPDMDTSQVTSTSYMLYGCAALTDGNVRLIGRHPSVDTTGMIDGSGLTREPWYNADGTPFGPREVIIKTGDYTMTGFDSSSATGDTSLIGGWPQQYSEYGVSFTAPVTCNLRVNNMSDPSRINAGETIPAGTNVVPTSAGTFVAHVFTEVL